MRLSSTFATLLTISTMLFSWCPALAQKLPAGFGQMSVTQPSRGTAVLTGQLLSTGGQNPTVKIRWGDEDRGTAVTPTDAWDNEVTVSTNQAAGTFSTTITIPNLEKVYYFRAIASNAGGSVVSRQLGVLVPNAPVGVANLQGRWDFDSANAKDSSGAGRDGTAKKLFSPTELSNMSLWLDASDENSITHSSNAVSQWADKSGNANHATQSTAANKPTFNMNAIDFDGSDDVLTLSSLGLSTDAMVIFLFSPQNESVYSVLGTNDTSTNNNFDLYSNDLTYAQHFRTARLDNLNLSMPKTGMHFVAYLADSGSSNYKIRINGNESYSNTTSFTFSDNITHIGRAGHGSTDFDGTINEILVINDYSIDTIKSIEGYLAHKWGLTSKLPSSHPYSLGHPIASSGSPSYITDTPFGSGKAI
ncbi:MAG: hypothetical protein VW576_03275, partial [Opitutae bacterium]